MIANVWDVVVVGAGPAGSATAARLAAGGYRILLLDRQHFPRPKPCGDCINPAGVLELDALNVLPALLREPHARIGAWSIVPRRGPSFRGSYPRARQGIAISRATLDQVLLDRARECGVEVETGVRVTQVLERDGMVSGVLVTGQGGAREIHCRLLVGADGLRSIVVRRLGLVRRSPRLRKLALTSHVRGLGAGPGGGELHILPRASLGIAPIGEDLHNVTLVVSGEEMTRVSGAREAYFDEVLGTYPRLCGGSRVDGVLATGPFDWPTTAAVTDGAMLVGDAAGYYDPFTGQGIYRALRGAALAAATADAALRANDLSAGRLWPYERARRRAFDPGTRLQRVIEPVLARPAWLRLAAMGLHRRPALADLLVGVTGDLEPVRALWAPETLARLVA